MRITTQMLNESAKKAGLSVNNKSLLNYINNDDKNNMLFNVLNKNKTAAVDTINRKNYEKLNKEADKLVEVTDTLLQDGKDNLFTMAKESGDNQKVYDSIESLFEYYNSTLKSLKSASGTMNNFYRQMLGETKNEAEEALEQIGITFEKDKTASIDIDKLKTADINTVEQLLGNNSDMIKKINFIAGKISDNAKANVESLSNSYSSKGSLYTGGTGSKYDLRG